MSDTPRSQITITLSERALSELREVSDWLGMPVATLVREFVEVHHQSPSFGNLVKRARGQVGGKY